MDLHLQSLELCLGQLRGEPAGFRFFLAQLAVVAKRVRHNERRPVDRQALMKVVDAESTIAIERKQCWIASKIRITQIPVERYCGRKHNKRKHNADCNVNEEVARKMIAQLKAAGQPEYQRRDHSPQKEVGKI